MEEKEIIQNLKKLSQIKPDREWVILTQKKILGESPSFFFQFKKDFLKWLALGMASIFVLFNVYFTYQSFPTEPLPKITFSQNKKENLKKLADIVEKNVSEVTRKLAKLDFSQTKPEVRKKIIKETKEITEKIKKLNQSLATKEPLFSPENIEKLEKISAKIECENLISDLEKRSLNEKQKEILNKMKKLAEKEEYQKALELWLENQ